MIFDIRTGAHLRLRVAGPLGRGAYGLRLSLDGLHLVDGDLNCLAHISPFTDVLSLPMRKKSRRVDLLRVPPTPYLTEITLLVAMKTCFDRCARPRLRCDSIARRE